jgi:uncharacterized membrane protein
MTQQNADRTVTEVAVVDVDVFDVYAICRDPLLLAPFVDDRVNVELIGDTRSRWTFPGPDGTPVSCTAELVGEVPERILAWRVEDGPLPHEGHVDFLRHGPGTASQLTVQVRYHQPPDGSIDPDLPRRRLHQTLGALAATTRRR